MRFPPCNRALGTVDVEDQRRRSAPSLNPVDPHTVQAGQRCQVPLLRQYSGLEAAHLALARRGAVIGATTDNAAHDRIARQPIGVVHVLIAGQAPEQGLSEQSEQGVLGVPARAAVAQFPTRHLGQAERRVHLPKQQQPAVGAELGAVEIELDPPVEIQPQSIALRLTRNGPNGTAIDIARRIDSTEKIGIYRSKAVNLSGGYGQGNRVNWGVTNRAGSESLLILLVGKEDLGNGGTSWDGRGGIRSGC